MEICCVQQQGECPKLISGQNVINSPVFQNSAQIALYLQGRQQIQNQ